MGMKVLIVGGGEDDTAFHVADDACKLQSVEVGHLNVAEDEIGIVVGEEIKSLQGTVVRSFQRESWCFFHIRLQKFYSQGLVIDNDAREIPSFHVGQGLCSRSVLHGHNCLKFSVEILNVRTTAGFRAQFAVSTDSTDCPLSVRTSMYSGPGSIFAACVLPAAVRVRCFSVHLIYRRPSLFGG